jgi:hypothetical protein
MPRSLLFIALIAAAATPAHAQRVRRPPPDRPARLETAPEADAEPAPTPSEPAAEGPEAPADPPRFSLFGDKSKFTRLGGWGGVGATMGQFGLGPSMLVMAPAVQEELALTDEQKQAIKDWTEEMRDRGREMAEGLREQGEAAMRGMDVVGVMQMMGQVNALLGENERGIERILTRKQWTRLQQINLQMQGLTALTRPDVARKLVLAPEQLEQIHAILAQAQFRQLGYWMQQGAAMRQQAEADRRRRDAGAPDPEAVPAEPAAEEADDRADRADAEPGDAEPRDARRRRMRSRFESMRDGADRLHQETIDRLLRVLTRRQRLQFERLLGPPFDPDALTPDPARRPPAPEDGDGEASAP